MSDVQIFLLIRRMRCPETKERRLMRREEVHKSVTHYGVTNFPAPSVLTGGRFLDSCHLTECQVLFPPHFLPFTPSLPVQTSKSPHQSTFLPPLVPFPFFTLDARNGVLYRPFPRVSFYSFAYQNFPHSDTQLAIFDKVFQLWRCTYLPSGRSGQ